MVGGAVMVRRGQLEVQGEGVEAEVEKVVRLVVRKEWMGA